MKLVITQAVPVAYPGMSTGTRSTVVHREVLVKFSPQKALEILHIRKIAFIHDLHARAVVEVIHHCLGNILTIGT